MGQAADRVADQASSMAAGGRQHAASVGDTVSDAAAAVGNRVSGAAGTVSDRVTGAASSVGNAVSGAASTVGNSVSGAASSLGNAAASAGDRVASGASAVGDTVSSAADQARRTFRDGSAKVSDAVDQVRQGAMELGETVQDYSAAMSEQAVAAAERTRQQAAGMARQAKETATTLVNEQPLLVAALGIALGALAAAALPKSKMEDEFMGEASDAVKGAFGEIASDQYEKAKTAAAGVADQAMAKAREEGLTPSGVADAARSAGEKFKRVANEAVGAATSALDEKSRKQS